jgi:hypothetical protein
MAEESHVREYVAVTRKHFASYHDHKEKMAYLTTVLYLTGISTLVFQKEPDWLTKLSCANLVIVTMSLGVLVFAFVFWQLLLRYRAAIIIAACDELRIRWLACTPNTPPLSRTEFRKIAVPQFLKDATKDVDSFIGLILASCLVLAIIIGWTIMLLWRIENIVCK